MEINNTRKIPVSGWLRRYLVRLMRSPILNIWLTVFVLATAFLQIHVAIADDAKPAKVRVSNVRMAFDNAEHNAFTDLCRFEGRYYLTFRSCPDGHGVNPTSSIIVLTSEDTQSWRQVHRFSVRERDVRDPHFLLFQGKLFVYTGTWYCGTTAPKHYDVNQCNIQLFYHEENRKVKYEL